MMTRKEMYEVLESNRGLEIAWEGFKKKNDLNMAEENITLIFEEFTQTAESFSIGDRYYKNFTFDEWEEIDRIAVEATEREIKNK